MICGIVGIGLSIIPVLGFLSFLLGPAAIALGTIAIVSDRGKSQGIAGVVTGASALVVASVVTLLFNMWLDVYEQTMYGL